MLTDLLLQLRSQHRGRDHGIKAPELAAICGCDTRHIRTMVRELRLEGHPICADACGYYFATTEEEYNALQRQLDGRAMDMLVTRRALRLAREEWRRRMNSTPVQEEVFTR